MNYLEKEKRECLENFLFLLIKKYKKGEEVNLVISNQINATFYCYNQDLGHQIHISLIDFEIFSKYELCYILAHEFGHFLENKNRRRRLKAEHLFDLVFFTFIANIFLIYSLILQLNNLSILWLILYYPLFVILFSHPFTAFNSRKEELKCDHFANTEIGGGKRVFIMTDLFEKSSKFSLKELLLKILKLGIKFNTYPKTIERAEEAKKFPINQNIKYFLDYYKFS